MILATDKPQTARFNVTEYHKILEAGVFPEGVRTELIDGEVYLMPPMSGDHYGILARVNRELTVRLDGKAVTVSQVPVELSDTTEPEPDFIILEYRDDYYRKRKGTIAESLLFVEVSKSTLDHDRRIKLPKYAESGIREVWIINATKDPYVLEVYSQPQGDEYTVIHKYAEGKLVAPLEFPDVEIRWW